MRALAFTILILFTISVGALSAQQSSSIIDTSHYFVFHSNYWINLHHFLYQKANGSQQRKLQEDGNTLVDIGEESIYNSLESADRSAYDAAVRYYQDSLADKSLFNLSGIRVVLQSQRSNQLSSAALPGDYIEIMNRFSNVYAKHYWPLHESRNDLVMEKAINQIKSLETAAVPRLAQMAGLDWPDVKIRVDLTAYANYAGAYTPTRPRMNIFISTLDPFATSTDFIETVFHEGSHVVFTRESEFRSAIYFTSEKMGIEFPRSLWHAGQFYLCGRLIQDMLATRELEHTLTMDLRNVFEQYNTERFRSILEEYYQGRTDLQTTVSALLKTD